MRSAIFIVSGLCIGVLISLSILLFTPFFARQTYIPVISPLARTQSREVIGFLPYWLLDRAQSTYDKDITTLTYFALRIDKDGSILKLNKPTEAEPGWYALKSGKVNQFLDNAKKHHVALSLALDSGDVHAIDAFISHPAQNAKRLTDEVVPMMKQHGFSDLNLDVEYTQEASPAAQHNFTAFVQHVRANLPPDMTLTLEISPIEAIMQRLIIPKDVAPYADYIVIMAYDYHAPDSFVTGPVAPLGGAGISSEYDVATAVNKTVQVVPSYKVILGMPLYGYEWETLGRVPRSAVIPGSGVLASSRRVETLIGSCASCSAQIDKTAHESYISYFNDDTHTQHILFFPDQQSTIAKIDFARKTGLGGIALWALGYEGNTILTPLASYKN